MLRKYTDSDGVRGMAVVQNDHLENQPYSQKILFQL